MYVHHHMLFLEERTEGRQQHVQEHCKVQYLVKKMKRERREAKETAKVSMTDTGEQPDSTPKQDIVELTRKGLSRLIGAVILSVDGYLFGEKRLKVWIFTHFCTLQRKRLQGRRFCFELSWKHRRNDLCSELGGQLCYATGNLGANIIAHISVEVHR